MRIHFLVLVLSLFEWCTRFSLDSFFKSLLIKSCIHLQFQDLRDNLNIVRNIYSVLK